MKEIRFDAHHLWKFIESICEEDGDDEDREEEEESLEKCTTTTTHTHPLVTPSEEQGAESTESIGSQLKPVRPVLVSDRSDQEPEEEEQEMLPKAIKTSTSFRDVSIFQ